MSQLTEESIRILRALNHAGGRLHGRFDQDTPFVLVTPGNPAPDRREVPLPVAGELHDAGLIQIDEAAPIADIYVFELSAEGKAYSRYSELE